ncbi:SsrA-binding protein [Mycoplasma sp. ATU-Cv-508]|uniref:SsrA-binding protein n=1 Tax=Mycoplasma sp. ATU-Cv-508 TaxID=2048001 RepID=UPI00191BCAAC
MAKVIAKNPLARWNFDLLETYQAGLVLEGWEVKSIRQKKLTYEVLTVSFESKNFT